VRAGVVGAEVHPERPSCRDLPESVLGGALVPGGEEAVRELGWQGLVMSRIRASSVVSAWR
jgi:hypothetical protein